MGQRTISDGECLADLAQESGLYWETIWNDPANDALRRERGNPNVLRAGDKVFIPDLRLRHEPSETTRVHYFRLKGVPVKLLFRLLTLEGEPRPGVAYEIEVDGAKEAGTSADDGLIEHNIASTAKAAKLRVLDADGEEESFYEFQLARLDPVSTVRGARGRLVNLGFLEDGLGSDVDDALREATRRFQVSAGLAATGRLDAATEQALLGRHGC